MAKKVVILCDERDSEIAFAAAAALRERGLAPSVVRCDAAAETLGTEPRDAMSGAAAIIVVVREAGRGQRLLRAVEDEAAAGTSVMSLVADASPDAAVSARTAARIRTLGSAVSAALGGGAPARRRTWPLAVAAAAVLIAVIVAVLRFWPGAPTAESSPVLLTGMLSNSGWIITFHLREEASVLEYRRPSDPEFVPTGDMGPGSGPSLGRAHAKPYVILADVRGKVPFLVRYMTMEGERRGPYQVVFDTEAEAVASVKRLLADIPGWIDFRLFNGRKLCYFSSLLSYKYALSEIRYGVDTSVPDRTLRFVPSDVAGIHNDDQIYIDLPPDTSSVTVELVFRDGSKLGPKRFPFRSAGQGE